MSRFLLLNLEDFGLSQDITKTIQPFNPFCICCLDRDGPMLDLEKCDHSDYLDIFDRAQLKQFNQLVCLRCHSVLKKIKLFRAQVLESYHILLSGAFSNTKVNNKKINSLIIQKVVDNLHLPPEEASYIDKDFESNQQVCSNLVLNVSNIEENFPIEVQSDLNMKQNFIHELQNDSNVEQCFNTEISVNTNTQSNFIHEMENGSNMESDFTDELENNSNMEHNFTEEIQASNMEQNYIQAIENSSNIEQNYSHELQDHSNLEQNLTSQLQNVSNMEQAFTNELQNLTNIEHNFDHEIPKVSNEEENILQDQNKLNKNIRTALEILERNNQNFVTIGSQLQFLNGEYLSYLEPSLLSKEILTDLPLIPVKNISTDLENGLIDNTKSLEIEIDGTEKMFFDSLDLSPELIAKDTNTAEIMEEFSSSNAKIEPKIKSNTLKARKKRISKSFESAKYIRRVQLTHEDLDKERVLQAQSDAYLRHKFRCETCIIGFNYKENLDDHIRRKHGPREGSNVVCEICFQVIPDAGHVTEHNYRHYTRYECVRCKCLYHTHDEAAQHCASNCCGGTSYSPSLKLKKPTTKLKKTKFRTNSSKI